MSYRLAVLTTHPIQYQAPLHATLAAHAKLSLKVFFCHDYGVRPQESFWGPRDFTWAAPLLEGYDYEFLPNWSRHPGPERLTGSINPAVIERMARERADAWIIHGWAYPTYLLAIAAGSILRRPLLLRVETNLLTPVNRRRRLWRRLVRPRILNRFDGYLAIGRANAVFYRHYGVPEDRVFHVPYSVDNDDWQREAAAQKGEVQAARTELGIAADAVVFLFCARFIPVKRVFDLIDAFGRIARGHSRAHLLLVGSGPELEEAKRRAAPTPRTTFAGFLNQNELGRMYALSDVLVLPSAFEPWGLVVNEAMNFGNAVIVSDRCGSAFDLVDGRGTGEVFPAGDVGSLERAMVRMLAEPERLRAAQENAKVVVNECSFTRAAQGVVRAVRRVARA